MLAPHLGSFASISALNAAFPPANVPVGSQAYTADRGNVYSNGIAWHSMGVNLGSEALSLKSTFAPLVANAPLMANYQFGTGAGGAGITAITNQTDLAAHFNAFEDFTAGTSINSELERFQAFNSTNHAFNASDLTLQVVNPGNDWQVTAVSQIAAPVVCDGSTANPIANLGLANTSAVELGQMCAIQGGGNVGGNYRVTGLVPNVSVTLTALNGSPGGTNASTGLIFWLPVYGATLSATYTAGGPTMTFSSLPAGVVNGMAVGVYNSPLSGVTLNRQQDCRVTNISGGLVTLSSGGISGGVGTYGVGTLVWFLPAITSGQIWSQDQFDLTNPQTFFAIEFDVTKFGPAGANRTAIGTNGELTLAQFNSIPAATPFGGWPADWMYSADDGNSATETSSASEFDCVEIQMGCTQDCTYMNTGSVGVTGSATLFTKNDSGWTNFAAFGIAIAPPGTNFVGRNLYQTIITNGAGYRFFNGVLYQARQFVWTNQRPAQFSVGIASGGLTAPLTANTIFPNNPAGFPDMNVKIHGIRVWYQPPAA